MILPMSRIIPLLRCLFAACLLATGSAALSAAEKPLTDASNWGQIDGTYWSHIKAAPNNPQRIQRNIYAGTKAGQGSSQTQTTFIPLQGAGRYELSGMYSTIGELARAKQQLEVTFYNKDGKALGSEATQPQYSYFKPARFAQWVNAPQGAAKAQVTLKVEFLKDFTKATSIRFSDIELLSEQQALAARAARNAERAAERAAVKQPANPVKFDADDKGPVTPGNLSIGKFYRVSRQPAVGFADVYPSAWSDGSRLTDGRSQPAGIAEFKKQDYVGWRGLEPLEVTIDLGRAQTLEEVIVRGFHSDEGYMFIPKNLSIATRMSDEGAWQTLNARDIDGYEGFTDTTYAIELNVPPTQARYVKLTFQPRGTHPVSMLMIDQIELLGQIKNTWRKVPSQGALHGAFPTAVGFTAEERNGRNGMVVDMYEEMVGKQLAMVLWYQRMEPGRDFVEIQRYRDDELSRNYYGTRFLQVGWEPGNLQDIIEGKYDDYLAQYFRDSIDPAIIGENTDPVWFRPMSEFNGGWVSWGLEPENLRQAWRRMYNIAEQVGATDHHIFLWSPNHRSYPDTEWNNVKNYWPGDQYVDWVGISSYPPSTLFVQDEDRRYPVKNIAEIYDTYADYKPFMITEGAYDPSVDRPRFVREWFEGLKEHRPKVKILIWENHNQRILSHHPESLEVYRELVQDPYWISETWSGE